MTGDRRTTMTRRAFVGGMGALGAALAAGALAGCGDSASNGGAEAATTSSANAKHQVTVAMSTSNEPASGFDPCINWGCGEHVHEPLIQSTLIVTDEDMNFVNDLATSYEVSTDKLTWTFKIRDDAKFTDGEPLRASDVAFTINTIVNSKNSEADLSMVSEATALDDTTVELRLNKPSNVLLYTLAVMGIVPEHAYGPDYGSNPVGSGRYKLVQWDKGQQAVFEANPDYYGDAPNIQRVVAVFMEEDAARAAVMSGQVDMAYTTAISAGFDLGAAASDYTLDAYETVDSRGISLPVIPSGSTKADSSNEYPAGNDVTCNLEVRQAINYGIDRQGMIDNVLNGYGSPAFSVGDGMPWASPDMRCEQDVKKAQGLLEAAGWTRASDGDTYAKDGKECAFDLWYPSNDSVRQAMANEFANQMAGVGIRVTPRGGSWDELYPHEFSDPIMWGWGSNSPSDVYEMNHSKGTMNYACFADETTDEYLDQALAADTVEDSYPLWQRSEWDGTEGVAPQGQATWAWFANVKHLFWRRNGLTVAAQKLQPHGHGWSVLNNVDRWTWS